MQQMRGSAPRDPKDPKAMEKARHAVEA